MKLLANKRSGVKFHVDEKRNLVSGASFDFNLRVDNLKMLEKYTIMLFAILWPFEKRCWVSIRAVTLKCVATVIEIGFMHGLRTNHHRTCAESAAQKVQFFFIWSQLPILALNNWCLYEVFIRIWRYLSRFYIF